MYWYKHKHVNLKHKNVKKVQGEIYSFLGSYDVSHFCETMPTFYTFADGDDKDQ